MTRFDTLAISPSLIWLIFDWLDNRSWLSCWNEVHSIVTWNRTKNHESIKLINSMNNEVSIDPSVWLSVMYIISTIQRAMRCLPWWHDWIQFIRSINSIHISLSSSSSLFNLSPPSLSITSSSHLSHDRYYSIDGIRVDDNNIKLSSTIATSSFNVFRDRSKSPSCIRWIPQHRIKSYSFDFMLLYSIWDGSEATWRRGGEWESEDDEPATTTTLILRMHHHYYRWVDATRMAAMML